MRKCTSMYFWHSKCCISNLTFPMSHHHCLPNVTTLLAYCIYMIRNKYFLWSRIHNDIAFILACIYTYVYTNKRTIHVYWYSFIKSPLISKGVNLSPYVKNVNDNENHNSRQGNCIKWEKDALEKFFHEILMHKVQERKVFVVLNWWDFTASFEK